MRIAHFVHRYPPALGGSEAYFARLSRYLAQAGEQVTVHTSQALDLSAFWQAKSATLLPGNDTLDGVSVTRHRISHWAGRRYVLKAISLLPHRFLQAMSLPCNPICPTMWQAAGAGPGFQFDVVHATAFPYAFPIGCAVRLAQTLRIPLCITPFLHLGDPTNRRDPTRRAYLSPALLGLLKRADVVFVQTQSERNGLVDAGFPTEKVVLQGLGVDAQDYTGGNRELGRQRFGIPPESIVIGHLANNSEEKGSCDLLRAAEQAWQRGATFRVMLAGPEMPNFAAYWRTFKRKDWVVRLGRLGDKQLREFYSAIDVFALPSRSDSFGLVLLEAWANAVPCIGYRAGGVSDIIKHESDGLLVPCGDIQQLARGLEALASDPNLRRRLGLMGQDRIPIEFDWQDKLRLVHDVYRDLVERKSRGRGIESSPASTS